MQAGLECPWPFLTEPDNASIVDEGQALEIATGLLRYSSGQRPVLFQFKTNATMIKEKEKGRPGLYFLITLQSGRFQETMACIFFFA